MTVYKKQLTKIYKPLNRSEQENLFTQIKNGNLKAREELITSCLPLVVKIAEKFHFNNKHIDIDDMIQEGNLALIRAVDNWDYNKSVISTVVTHYVKNSLLDMITDAKYNIQSPYSMSRTAAYELRKVENNPNIKIKPKRLQRLLNCKVKRVCLSSADVEEARAYNGEKCIVDIYYLSNTYLDGIEKKIFNLYIGEATGTRMKLNDICKNLNMSMQDVKCTINRCKRKLNKVAKQYA